MEKLYITKSINHFKNMYKDQNCIIIGGGPSIKYLLDNNYVFEKLLKNYIIIGTNVSYKFIPCHYMIFSDNYIWNQHYKDIKLFKDIICFTQIENEFKNINPPLNKEIIRIPTKGIYFPMLDNKGIKCNNIGSSALSLSHFLGFKNIFLFGIDMIIDENGNKNFHNEYIDKPKKTLKMFNQIITGHYMNMIKIIDQLEKKYKIKIFSCSTTSRFNEILSYVDPWELIKSETN